MHAGALAFVTLLIEVFPPNLVLQGHPTIIQFKTT